jgi:subtilase family serine protease
MLLFKEKAGCRHWKLTGLAALAAGSWVSLATNATAAERAVLDAATSSEQVVEFNVYLPLRDRAGAETFLNQLHDPNSASYHQWLSPAQVNERFGPQADTVVVFLSWWHFSPFTLARNISVNDLGSKAFQGKFRLRPQRFK